MGKAAEPIGPYLELTSSTVILYLFVFKSPLCFTGKERRYAVLNIKSVQVALLF